MNRLSVQEIGIALARAAGSLGYELALADLHDRPYVTRRRPRVKGAERELFTAIRAHLKAHSLPADEMGITVVLRNLGFKHE